MTRLAALVTAVALAAPAVAQPQPVPKDGKVTVSLTLSPAAARVPVSRDYLLPELQDSIPGNRVQMFLRCFMEQDALFSREEAEKRDKRLALPLAEWPKGEKGYVGGWVLTQMLDAARMTHADWQLEHALRRDGIHTVLPDVQKMRALAHVLRTHLRAQTAAADFDGAVRTARALLSLSRTMESNPTVIGHLVGVAIGGTACDNLEELIQRAGCPNLFWAVADLPTPFLSLRPGVQGDRLMIGEQLHRLLTATGPLTDRELKDAADRIDESVRIGDDRRPALLGPGQTAADVYTRWAADPKRVEAARTRLVEAGSPADAVKTFTPLQATIVDDVRRYEVARDEMLKWMNLPAWQAIPKLRAFEEGQAAVRAEGEQLLTPTLILVGHKVKAAQARLDQRLAYLRIIEAVRLHAHSHGGTLPASLDAIDLPLPLDPVSGKPFRYSVADGFATLTGENANPENERTNRVYHIRLRK